VKVWAKKRKGMIKLCVYSYYKKFKKKKKRKNKEKKEKGNVRKVMCVCNVDLLFFPFSLAFPLITSLQAHENSSSFFVVDMH
jgi:predicted ribosome-associated RNA-binding protein Tma20